MYLTQMLGGTIAFTGSTSVFNGSGSTVEFAGSTGVFDEVGKTNVVRSTSGGVMESSKLKRGDKVEAGCF